MNVVLNRTVVADSDCMTFRQPVNNNSPNQDYVHPDDQTQPTFKMTLVSPSLFLKSDHGAELVIM